MRRKLRSSRGHCKASPHRSSKAVMRYRPETAASMGCDAPWDQKRKGQPVSGPALLTRAADAGRSRPAGWPGLSVQPSTPTYRVKVLRISSKDFVTLSCIGFATVSASCMDMVPSSCIWRVMVCARSRRNAS